MAAESFIVCQQLPQDSVKYMTNLTEFPCYTSYKDFLGFISKFPIIDRDEFMLNFNRFYMIFVDLEEQGKWHIEIPENTATSKEIFELNAVSLNPEPRKLSEFDSKVQIGKSFIQQVSMAHDRSNSFYRK